MILFVFLVFEIGLSVGWTRSLDTRRQAQD